MESPKMADLACDARSAEWARSVGRRDRLEFPRGAGIRSSRICPFSEGTPHRRYWFEGWKGLA